MCWIYHTCSSIALFDSLCPSVGIACWFLLGCCSVIFIWSSHDASSVPITGIAICNKKTNVRWRRYNAILQFGRERWYGEEKSAQRHKCLISAMQSNPLKVKNCKSSDGTSIEWIAMLLCFHPRRLRFYTASILVVTTSGMRRNIKNHYLQNRWPVTTDSLFEN